MGRRGKHPKEKFGLRGGLGYSLELKLRAIKEIQRGAGVADLARYFGIGEKTLYNWLRTYRLQGVQGLTPLRQAPVPKPRSVDPRRDNGVAEPVFPLEKAIVGIYTGAILGKVGETILGIFSARSILPSPSAGVPASTPVGRLASPMSVEPGTNAPATIMESTIQVTRWTKCNREVFRHR